MSIVVENEEWALSPFNYVFLFAGCFFSVFLLPYFSRNSGVTRAATAVSSPFDVGPTAPFLRFQMSLLLVYSLASVMEGLESVYGEYEFEYRGMLKEQMVLVTFVGAAVSFVLSTFAGVLSDIMGPKKFCILFSFFHLLLGILKSVVQHPSMLLSSMCIGIASTIYRFCFEAWMVTEHEKQGYMIDLLNDNLWLMTLFEASSLLCSQGIVNFLIKDLPTGFLPPSAAVGFLAVISILYIRKQWNENDQKIAFGSYQNSFTRLILGDKSIWMLVLAQASVYFSMSVFGIIWAPTIMADGREVQLSYIYPFFLGSRMLGSTAFPWFSSIASPLHSDNHNHLIGAFAVAGMALLFVALDYQSIGVLVILFCIFHICIGLISPSLARLRTLYVPIELRGGMICASLIPANGAFLFVLLVGGYYRKLDNDAIMALVAIALLSAAGCIHVLRWWRKYPLPSRHELHVYRGCYFLKLK